MTAVSQPATAPAPTPGKGLGIAGLILAFLAPLIGLILSIVARNQSKRAGVPNTPATAGIWISIVMMVLTIAAIAITVVISMSAVTAATEICASLGEGVWELDGVTYTCG